MAAQFTEAAADAIGRSIAAMQRDFRQAEELRDAQFRAKIAELDAAELRRDAWVREEVAEKLAAIRDGKDGEHGRDGVDGKDIDPEFVRELVTVAVAAIPVPKDGERGADGKDGTSGRDGVDGKDIDPEFVRELVTEAVAAIPVPKDGERGADGKDGINGADGRDGEDGQLGRDGVDGKDADPELIENAVTEAVARAVGAIELPVGPMGPAGADGVPGAAGRDADPAVVRAMVDEVVATLPPAPPGKDADPAAVAEMVRAAVSELPPAPAGKDADPITIRVMVDEAVAAIPRPKDGERGLEGAPGKLPIVHAWTERVHYEGDVITHGGSTYQALRDTGREPPHDDDWRVIALGGKDGADGRSITVRGTYHDGEEYRGLDVVALNGASFLARWDAPGACPGEGWQLIAAQGKTGKPGERGMKGDRGERGGPGLPLVSGDIDKEGLLTLTNGDGSVVECDLYPLLEKALR